MSAYLKIKTIQKEVYSERKEFAPHGANSYHSEEASIVKGGEIENDRAPSPEREVKMKMAEFPPLKMYLFAKIVRGGEIENGRVASPECVPIHFNINILKLDISDRYLNGSCLLIRAGPSVFTKLCLTT